MWDLQVDKILQDTGPRFGTFFGMKLGSVEIIFMQCGTVWLNIIGSSNGMCAKGYVIAMNKIAIAVFSNSLHQR